MIVRICIAALLAVAAVACAPKAATSSDGAGAAPANSVDPFIGTWVHKGNIVAPWWTGPGPQPEPDPEIVATPLVISASSTAGPKQLSCEQAIYEVTTSGLEGLFEGLVTDHYIGSSVLGIEKDQVPTLAEGCKSTTGDLELNYHLIDKDKMLLGLNNIVYQFERQKS